MSRRLYPERENPKLPRLSSITTRNEFILWLVGYLRNQLPQEEVPASLEMRFHSFVDHFVSADSVENPRDFIEEQFEGIFRGVFLEHQKSVVTNRAIIGVASAMYARWFAADPNLYAHEFVDELISHAGIDDLLARSTPSAEAVRYRGTDSLARECGIVVDVTLPTDGRNGRELM